MDKYITIGKNIIFCIIILLVFGIFNRAVAANPASTHYSLQDYSFGSGGTSNNTGSSNFKIFGVSGEIEFGKPASANFGAGTGLTYLQTQSLPPAPTFTNPSSYYNKLQLQITTTGNSASDVVFAIAVQNSSDSFASTQYVQTDDTLGSSPVWQTNAVWGAGGFIIIGLTPGLTYKAAVSAKQGNFSQSSFGPTASVATSNPTMSFSLSSNSLTLSQINPASVVSSSSVTATVSTNSNSGATIYGYDSNGALLSSSTSDSITSGTANLGATAGYGLQATSVTQTSGGPMESLSPYNGINDNVGILGTSKAVIFDSSQSPVTSGQGVFVLKAKATNTTRAASDYADIVTIIASGIF